MVRGAIQLYTLRNVDDPFSSVLEHVAAAGFEGVEFAFTVPELDPEKVRSTLLDTGLDVAGAHVSIDRLEEDLEATATFYERLGCSDVVVPSLDRSHFETRESAARTADRLHDLADRVADHGLSLHYHNHDHEFVPLDGDTGFDAFLDATDDRLGIELDLGLAFLGGADPVALLDRLGDRVRLAHLKDVDRGAGESVPLGHGDLDVEACATAFRRNGGRWLIYEYTGPDPMSSLDDAGAAVRDLR